MSLIKIEDTSKWINAFMIIAAVFAGYIANSFLYQLSDWFDLEARIRHYRGFAQLGGLSVGVGTYLLLRYRKAVGQHLDEVYTELVKVIWPDRDSTFKVTIGIMIAVAIVSALLVLVDFIVNQVLNLIYG